MIQELKKAKPFLKWAGGKTQLINQIKNKISNEILTEDFIYIEPFIGSGAVLFSMINEFSNIKKIIINDNNVNLINTYLSIKKEVQSLINILAEWENEYHNLGTDTESKKEYYYKKRNLFNSQTATLLIQSALFIFLNRTCFNGLYRVNKKGEFNVPIGNYNKPKICNQENLLLVSNALKKVIILNGDYSKTLKYAQKKTLFYLDPPYKPLTETSGFNSYNKNKFNDEEQIRLKKFCDVLNNKNYKWILSNSDVRAINPKNNFFDKLYSNFNIQRVSARRNINSNPNKRGKLTELLITN